MSAKAFITEHAYAIAGGVVVLGIVYLALRPSASATTPNVVVATPTNGSQSSANTQRTANPPTRTLLQRVVDLVKPASSTQQIASEGTGEQERRKAELYAAGERSDALYIASGGREA